MSATGDPSEEPVGETADQQAETIAEPSTETEPGDEAQAPGGDDPEPDHRAVGIGVIDGPKEES